jgi:uncharacterized protein (DUF305 family)
MTYTRKQLIIVGIASFSIGIVLVGIIGGLHRKGFENRNFGNGYRGSAMMHRMADGTVMANGMMNGTSTMNGMMAGMVLNMKGKTGKNLEKAFLVDMIPHHQGAVEMAKLLVADPNVSPELKAFAQNIITAQEGEIEKMNMWVKSY